MEEGFDYFRRSLMANALLGRSIQGLRAMCDLLGEAQVSPQSIGDTGQQVGVITLGHTPLCLQFGKYHTKIAIVEDTLTLEGQENDGEGSKVGVRSNHLRIALQIDVESIAPNAGGDK